MPIVNLRLIVLDYQSPQELAKGACLLVRPNRRTLWRGAFADSALLIAARIGAAGLALSWMVALSAAAGPATAGVVLTGIALAELTSILATLNVESGALRTLPGAMLRRETDRAFGFIRFSLLVAGLGGLAAATLFFVAGTPLTQAEHLHLKQGLPAIACAIPLVALARVTARLGTALGCAVATALPRLLLPGSGLLALVAIQGSATTSSQMLAAFAAAYALTGAVQWWFLRRARVLPAPAGASDMTDWQSWIRAGLRLVPSLALQEYRRSLLIATAALGLGAGALAGFGIALSLTGFVFFALTAVDAAFASRLARAVQGDKADLRDMLLQRVGVIKLGLASIGLPGIPLTGWVLLPAVGAEGWAQTLAVAAPLLVVPLVQSLLGPSAPLLTMSGAFASLFRAALAGLLATVALTALGALSGSPLAASSGAAAGLILYQIFLRHRWLGSGGVDPSPWAVRRRQNR